MFTGSPGPVIRQKAKGTRPLRNLQRRAARRTVLPGYPLAPRSLTREEIRSLFSGDKIVCFLCGKPYKKLGVHLLKIHSVHPDDYKKMFGLPWSRGLASGETREKMSVSMKKRIEEGDANVPVNLNERIKGIKHRRSCFQTEVLRENILKANGKTYSADIFDVFLERINQLRTPASVYRDPDMPSFSWFREHYKSHPENQFRFQQLIAGKPYSFQAKCKMLGESFDRDAKKLRESGLHFYEIAEKLGVTTMCVHRRLRA